VGVVLAGLVGGQVQHRQRRGQRLLPVRYFALARGGVEAPGLPGHVVAVLQRRRRPHAVRAGQRQFEELADKEAQRPTVEDDVVKAQAQHGAAVFTRRQHRAPARAAAQVDALAHDGLGPGALGSFRRRQRRGLDL